MSKIHNVTPLQLKQWLESNEAVLVDVREPSEYNSEYIAEARNLPLSKVTIDEAHLPEHHHKKLVIHCKSGGRSLLACEKLKNDGAPYDIWNLEGGILAWKKANLPTHGSGKKVIPVMQQVQIVLGILVLIGTLCGLFLHPLWFAFPIIISLGLINAGCTGWCGMAKLISKFPWNKR